jgi:hypothetical protein
MPQCSSHASCQGFLSGHCSRRSRDHHHMPTDLFDIMGHRNGGMRKLCMLLALVFALVTGATTTGITVTV